MRRSDRELTSREDFRSILEEADVCRIALNSGKAPYIVPLNFGYSWAAELELYFHSAAEGRKIDLIERDSDAGFEMDTSHELVKSEQACGWGMKYKCLIGTGKISFIEGEKEKKDALNLIMKKYGYVGEAAFDDSTFRKIKVYKLVVGEMSGKQKK